MSQQVAENFTDGSTLPKNALKHSVQNLTSVTASSEDHFEDTKRFHRLETQEKIDNFHKSHLVRFCKKHEEELLEKYPRGRNTCTCRNVKFTRFQCNSCFTEKVEKLQRNFRARVDPKWRGEADKTITGNNWYYEDWRGVRTMLQDQHPCSRKCGEKRQTAFHNLALDCRCCGGMILQRTAARRIKVVQPVKKRPVIMAKPKGRA